MDIDYTVAALMFPAIPLMMTMYSNRFHTLSALIRKIHDQYTFEKKVRDSWGKHENFDCSDTIMIIPMNKAKIIT